MIELLAIVFANALLISGLHLASYEGMILGFLPNLGLPSWLEKPLFDCPTCMASVHGTYPYLIASSIINLPLWGLVIYIPVLAGMSTLVWRIIDSLEKPIKDDWDNISRHN
jgi:hypothetical protein